MFLMEVKKLCRSASEADVGLMREGVLERVVDAMHYDVLHCSSYENPKPRDIIVHGVHGFCSEVAASLSSRLGDGYVVDVVRGDSDFKEDGHYYLNLDWYIEKYGEGNGD